MHSTEQKDNGSWKERPRTNLSYTAVQLYLGTIKIDCTGTMSRLGEAYSDRVEERAKARSLREEKRTARLLNSKLRTIGVDAAFLEQQVEEKRRLSLLEREAKAEEAAYEARLIQHLEDAEAAEVEEKAKVVEDVKQTLLNQMAVFHEKNQSTKSIDPVDLESCGPASAQIFTGDDVGSAGIQRTKLQQEQVRVSYHIIVDRMYM